MNLVFDSSAEKEGTAGLYGQGRLNRSHTDYMVKMLIENFYPNRCDSLILLLCRISRSPFGAVTRPLTNAQFGVLRLKIETFKDL